METERMIVVHEWERYDGWGTRIFPLPAKIVQGQFRKDIDGGIWNTAFIFPISYEVQIRAILAKRIELKKACDDSMKLVYELCNCRARGEVDPKVV